MKLKKFKINVKAITKDLLFAGEKGTYLSGSVVDTPKSEFGVAMLVQDLSKEDQEFNKKLASQPNHDKNDFKQGVILGNIYEIEFDGKLTDEQKEDLPF